MYRSLVFIFVKNRPPLLSVDIDIRNYKVDDIGYKKKRKNV